MNIVVNSHSSMFISRVLCAISSGGRWARVLVIRLTRLCLSRNMVPMASVWVWCFQLQPAMIFSSMRRSVSKDVTSITRFGMPSASYKVGKLPILNSHKQAESPLNGSMPNWKLWTKRWMNNSRAIVFPRHWWPSIASSGTSFQAGILRWLNQNMASLSTKWPTMLRSVSSILC